MTGKNEITNENKDSLLRIKQLANKRKFLEDKSIQIQEEIRHCFAKLSEVLQSRERQLLCQVEAIYRQQLSLVQSSLDTLPPSVVVLNEKQDLEEQIRRFGRIEICGTNCITVKNIEPYKAVDYLDTNKDHISFDKSIKYCAQLDHEIDRQEGLRDDQLCISSCKNILSSCSHFYYPKRSTSLTNKTNSMQELITIPKMEGELTNCKHTKDVHTCTPFLVLKQDFDFVHVASHKLRQCDRKCLSNVEIVNVTKFPTDTTMSTSNSDKINMINERDKGVCSSEKVFLEENDSSSTKTHSQDSGSYEHPKQVQQWLQQILFETEIEPTIHEIEQLGEISETRLSNKVQLGPKFPWLWKTWGKV
ncbi:hypothetical protein KM043_018693 [Ampulex compressa]|nr:hypothetical protein KM043_018693 [Ampulex compressa]